MRGGRSVRLPDLACACARGSAHGHWWARAGAADVPVGSSPFLAHLPARVVSGPYGVAYAVPVVEAGTGRPPI